MKQIVQTTIHLKTLTVIVLLLNGIIGYAQNSAPIATDDTYRVGYNVTRTITATNGVLSNDSDVDGRHKFTSSHDPDNRCEFRQLGFEYRWKL